MDTAKSQSTARSTESFQNLLKAAKDSTSKSLPEDSWYIIVAATLITADGAENFGTLYKYLVSELASRNTQDNRRRISQRLREVIIKSWTLVGMPRASIGYFSLIQTEAPEDAAVDFDRAEYRATLHADEVSNRAQGWISQEFAEDETGVLDSLSTNPDLAWAIKHIQYGYFLADLSVLDPIENELIILACVMGQGAAIATFAHIKSLRRLGVSASDAESFQRVVEMVAKWQGKDTSSWHQVKEVEHLFN